MGGYGSTRWGDHSKRLTVEGCRVIDASSLYRDKRLGWGLAWSGKITWSNSATGATLATVGLAVDTTDRARPWLRFTYTVTDRLTEEKADYDYRVPLSFTPLLPLGAGRWWMVCPLVKEGKPCGRRVQKLYLPPGGRYFGCRHCYDLTYRSCQESDKRVSQMIGRMLAGGFDAHTAGYGDLLLYLKAWERVERRINRGG